MHGLGCLIPFTGLTDVRHVTSDTPSGVVVAEDQEREPKSSKMTISVIQSIPLYALGSSSNTTWVWTAAWLARYQGSLTCNFHIYWGNTASCNLYQIELSCGRLMTPWLLNQAHPSESRTALAALMPNKS